MKDIGECKTYNCGRGAKRTQFNLRGSKRFKLHGSMADRGDRRGVQSLQREEPEHVRSPTTTRLLGSRRLAEPELHEAAGVPGDFENPDQRVGQIGFRFTF